MPSKNREAQCGFVRLELIVATLVIAILATILFHALHEAQRQMERMLVETELMTLRTELQIAVASAINRGTQAQLSGWVGRNPFELVDRPSTQQGVGEATLANKWRWDSATQELVYDSRDGGKVHVRVEAAMGSVTGWSLGGGLLLTVRKSDEWREQGK